jgi:hypothetical protein
MVMNKISVEPTNDIYTNDIYMKNKKKLEDEHEKGNYETYNGSYMKWKIDGKYDLIDDKILYRNGLRETRYHLSTRKHFINDIIKSGRNQPFYEHHSTSENIRISKCCFYVDYDIKNPDEKLKRKLSDDDINNIYITIIDKLLSIFQDTKDDDYTNCYKYSIRQKNKEEPTPYLSFHIVCKKIYFANAKNILIFLKQQNLNFKYENMDINFDENPYKIFGCFRAPFCIKDGESFESMLNEQVIFEEQEILPIYEIIERMLITYIRPDAILINIEIKNEKELINMNIEDNIEDNIEKSTITNLIEMLDKNRANDYNKWVEIIFALRETENVEYAKKFSKYCMAKYDEKSIETVFNAPPSDNKISIKSLYYYAKLDSPEKYSKFMSEYSYSRDDYFCFEDFFRKYHGKNYEENKIDLVRDLKRVYAFIQCGKSCELIKTDRFDNYFDIDGNQALRKKFTMYHNKKKISFEQIITSNIFDISLYKNMEINPANSDSYNIWQGFSSKLIEKPNYKLIEPILSVIRECWCGIKTEEDKIKKQIIYDYIITWIHTLFFDINKRTNIAIFAYSEETGTGKNTLTNFIRNVMGYSVLETNGINRVTSNFNIQLIGKRLCILNECASTKNNFLSDFDKMKSMITDDILALEAKGKDLINVKNILNFILLSNHKNSLYIEKKDRRYLCLEIDACKKNDKNFWHDVYDCYTQICYDTFFTYVHDYSKLLNDLRSIPKTKLSEDIKGISMYSPERFLLDIKNDGAELSEINETEISQTILFKNYRKWCEENNEKFYSLSKFKENISSHIKINSHTRKYIINSIDL